MARQSCWKLLGVWKFFKSLFMSSQDDWSEPSISTIDSKSRRDVNDVCYACARKELPRFHSVSCEQENHSLLWEVNAGSSLCPVQSRIHNKPTRKKSCRRWVFGVVQDPRRKFIQKLNQWLLLSRSVSLAVDPLFFYVLIVSKTHSCLHMDGSMAKLVTCVRSIVDVVHLLHMWLQLKLAYVSKESLIHGRGSLVWDARKIAANYLRPGGGFWLDAFVILPVPQVVYWVFTPSMIKGGQIISAVTMLLITFLFQYIPKTYHSIHLARRMRNVTGYVFGTVWWGFTLNLTAYFIASHVAGACWYLLATQRVSTCLVTQCETTVECNLKLLGCSQPISYGGLLKDMPWSTYNDNQTLFSNCFRPHDFSYGIFEWAVPLVGEHGWSSKILYPFFWGIMTISSFGNALTPSNHSLEVVFSIIVIICGLLLFTLLIGNIQVCLYSITSKKEAMKLRTRDLEWWMRRRQLPSQLKHRVRRYERHHWAALRGVDEEDMVRGLPEGLRRDIKRHLCLDLVRQVPLFEQMDNLVLENICDLVKPHLFIKGEMVIREGDPVQRMLFVVRGHLRSSHELTNGQMSICYLGPGNFCGDELLSWCLRTPFVERLPPSCATFTSIDSTEAFGLEAHALKYVTEHFRYRFVNERLRRTARYYSFGWRTWAVVTIQLAWRRSKARRKEFSQDKIAELRSRGNVGPRISPIARSQSERECLRFYAAMLNSHKPQDHLE